MIKKELYKIADKWTSKNHLEYWSSEMFNSLIGLLLRIYKKGVKDGLNNCSHNKFDKMERCGNDQVRTWDDSQKSINDAENAILSLMRSKIPNGMTISESWDQDYEIGWNECRQSILSSLDEIERERGRKP